MGGAARGQADSRAGCSRPTRAISPHLRQPPSTHPHGAHPRAPGGIPHPSYMRNRAATRTAHTPLRAAAAPFGHGGMANSTAVCRLHLFWRDTSVRAADRTACAPPPLPHISLNMPSTPPTQRLPRSRSRTAPDTRHLRLPDSRVCALRVYTRFMAMRCNFMVRLFNRWSWTVPARRGLLVIICLRHTRLLLVPPTVPLCTVAH